jgi:hypothetical protein
LGVWGGDYQSLAGEIIMEIVIQGLIAIGTIATAILAIWGEYFRSWLVPPKLEIRLHTPEGSLTTFTDGSKVFFYHVKVENSRPWAVARNCRVLLMKISKRGPDNIFRSLPFPVPHQYVWSPSEITPTFVNIQKEHILDFGYLSEKAKFFQPVLYSYSNNFQGYLREGESIRYSLEIVADGFSSNKYFVFEVTWNGKWDESQEQMRKHLIIKEIFKN